MTHKNSDEETKRYEKEFSEFLTDKINHAGGSLQFQHLSGILQQLRFEVRNAVASSKPELMKFLRAHTKIFKIDSKGLVSVVSSSLPEGDGDDNNNNDDDNGSTEQGSVIPAKKNVQTKIHNGEGTVIKIDPEYAIIKAFTPIKALVYFTPLDFGGDKDYLFGLHIDLEPRTEVCFNAEYGHSDYGIEYRANKVWLKPKSDDDESPDPPKHKKNKSAEDLLTGKGVIGKVHPTFGFISVSDGGNKSVFFYKSSVQDCDENVDEFFKVGDHVEFIARPDVGNSKAKWKAISVTKVKTKQSCNRQSSDQPSDFAENIKNRDASDSKKNRIENQSGKIYAYAHGAVIKFGNNYSQKADGDTSDYYLYGSKIKVSDIIWEFSEGDDVLFDAVKMKQPPGWKAYLVWTGEKPASRNIPQVDDDSDENTEKRSSSSVVSSDNSNSLVRSKTKHKKDFCPENKENNKSNTMDAHSYSKKSDKSHNEYNRKENYSKAKSSDKNIPVNQLKFKKANYKCDKKNTMLNKFAKKNRNAHFPEQSSYAAKHDKNLLSKESEYNISTESSEDSSEDEEFHDAASNQRKFLIEKQYDDSSSSSENNNYDNESNEARQNNENKLISKKASIKKFEGVPGKISSVLCKAAMIRSSLFERDIDFVLSTLYLEGESAEELQVIDLKEIINVGDPVSFNGFEIIDDSGELYQKVTLAWIGPKPDVHETTPEDFICENELSVSLRTSMDEHRTGSRSEAKGSEKSDKTADFYSETESALNVMLNDKVNSPSSHEPEIEIPENLNDSDQSSATEDEEESLSNKIIQRLKMHGFFSEDSQILEIVPEIIDLVLKKYRIIDSRSEITKQGGISPEVLCSSCLTKNMSSSNKDTTAKHAAVQTIITGEIVATSIFAQC